MLNKDDRLIFRSHRFFFTDHRGNPLSVNDSTAWKHPGATLTSEVAQRFGDRLRELLSCNVEILLGMDQHYEWHFKTQPKWGFSARPTSPFEIRTDDVISDPKDSSPETLLKAQESEKAREDGFRGIAWVLRALFAVPFEIRVTKYAARFIPPPPR